MTEQAVKGPCRSWHCEYLQTCEFDIQVLEQYANVKHRDQLRCNAAFFMGLLKQVTDGKPPRVPSSAGKSSVLTVPKPLEADPSTVSPEAKQKLAELYSLGILDNTLMDQHCLGLLAAIPACLQVHAISCLAEGISVAENKRAYITQLLKSIRASAGSSAAAALKSGMTPLATPSKAAANIKLVSNTGKVINPNDISIRLNPSSIFYDADLAMCWRVLTRQDKAGWQVKAAAGKHPKLASLSKPRQKLARQLHPGHAHFHAATAAVWKHTDPGIKEDLLHDADSTGEPITVLPHHQRLEPDPQFHDMDFPPLGGVQASNPIEESGATADQITESAVSATGLSTEKTINGAPLSQRFRTEQSSGSSDIRDSQPNALPLYNMGMAFQQSLSLQDISQGDPSMARDKPLTDTLSEVPLQLQCSVQLFGMLVSCGRALLMHDN